MKSVLHLPHGDLRLPNFLPDATLGVVRNVDSSDLEQCGIEALVMNTFHLMQRPGSSTINALGGLHKMCGWQHPITTDSGGFQAYSLIRQNAKYGYMNDKGITFQPENSDRKFHLTPEKSIQLQVSYGADIVVCLDDCTHVDDPFETQQESVQRTIAWAKRCKEEFLRLMKQKRLAPEQQPLLFGVIQGGGFLELRKQCADALQEIGFDGYGFGGWPLDNKGNLLTEIVRYTRELVREWPMHALGVGHPANVAACARMGYELFDSAMPTRDARHFRLYAFTRAESLPAPGSDERWFQYVYVNDDKAIKNTGPISPYCDCLCCRRYSVAYLHHLYKIDDSLFLRLATMHNLRFMAQLMERLRAEQHATIGQTS
jgi:queuine tRNA-ribosyltransferase